MEAPKGVHSKDRLLDMHANITLRAKMTNSDKHCNYDDTELITAVKSWIALAPNVHKLGVFYWFYG